MRIQSIRLHEPSESAHSDYRTEGGHIPICSIFANEDMNAPVQPLFICGYFSGWFFNT